MSVMCMHHAYIYPPIAKFVDTWTQPYKSLPVYGLAVSSGLACVQAETGHTESCGSHSLLSALLRRAEALARWLQDRSHPCRADGNSVRLRKTGYIVATSFGCDCVCCLWVPR